jgi:hypothetical protein
MSDRGCFLRERRTFKLSGAKPKRRQVGKINNFKVSGVRSVCYAFVGYLMPRASCGYLDLKSDWFCRVYAWIF